MPNPKDNLDPYSDDEEWERLEYEERSEAPSDPSARFDYDPEEMERSMRYWYLGVKDRREE